MFSRIMKVTRAVGFSIALLALSGGAPLMADPTDCPETGVGTTTGNTYRLQSQSLATESTSGSFSVGGSACGVGGSASGTFTEQYHIGYYVNTSTNAVARVDCRTGRILGWE